MTAATALGRKLVVKINQAVKTYGTTRALTGADLEIYAGQVLGVVGHNGAGKSTLMRVLTGLARLDSGTVEVAGSVEPGRYGFPSVRMAFQEGSLALELTVKENIYLSSTHCMPGWRWHGAASDWATRRLKEIFPEHTISPDDYVEELVLADRQRVEIARATISDDLKLLILDEPTESLSGNAVKHLYDYVRRMRDTGMAIVLVSHRLKEILSVSDRVAVMKDGAVVAVHRTNDISERDLFFAMGGEDAGAEAGQKISKVLVDGSNHIAIRLPMTTVESAATEIVAFKGEVVGLAGIAGQGQEAVLNRLWRGKLHDSEIAGIRAYVPGDRQRSGIFPLWDVARNLTITALPRLSKNGIRQVNLEKSLVEAWVKRLKIRGGAHAQITALSGGNQQKVIVARAFASHADTILLDDPFRGVDIHTKIELYELIRAEAGKGRTIIWYSSENSEMRHCDRVYVLRADRIAGELKRPDITDERIIAMSFKETGVAAA